MLTNEEIIWGYRYILGREPDSEAMEAHRGHADVTIFRRILLESYEFRTLGVGPYAARQWVLAPGPSSGDYIWADVADRMIGYDVIHQSFEPTVTRVFAALANHASGVIDVGANIGWYTLLAARLVGEEGRVLAFEPNPAIAERLRLSVALNGYDSRVSVFEEALADREGRALLARPTRVANWGNAFLQDGADPTTHECFDVALATLDSRAPPVVDLIKIDCEGAEPMVIAGAVETLTRHRPLIISEVFDAQLRDISHCSAEAYVESFIERGYVTFALEERRVARDLRDWRALPFRHLTNVVFVPAEREQAVAGAIQKAVLFNSQA